jgi:hypothetical protein
MNPSLYGPIIKKENDYVLGAHLIDRADPVVAGGVPCLATQQKLGLWSDRRAGIDCGHRAYPLALGISTLIANAEEGDSNMSRFVWKLTIVGLLAASGCGQKPADQTHEKKVTAEDVRRDADQAAKTAAEYSEQAKEELQKKLDARLKEMDAEIARLREKGRELTGEAKTKWEKKMADLETKRDAARAKLAEVGQSSKEAWKDVQKGAQSAWDEMDKALQDASNEF